MEITKKPDGKFELKSVAEVDETEMLSRRKNALRRVRTFENALATNAENKIEIEKNIVNSKTLLAKINVAIGKKAEDTTE